MFDHRHGDGLGHGAYDLTKLDESLIEKRIEKAEVEAVIQDLYKSEYWIPAFPLDGRNSYGATIIAILAVWLLVFVLLGATHRVLTASSALVAGGALLLAYLASWAAQYWTNGPISDSYLHEREKAFNQVVDAWNKAKKNHDCSLEVGRYGAYICLRFQAPVKKLGAFLMHIKRQHDREKEKPKTANDDLL